MRVPSEKGGMCICCSGIRRGPPSLLVFDLRLQCFVAQIRLELKGRLKFLFAPRRSTTTTSLIVVTERMHQRDPLVCCII